MDPYSPPVEYSIFRAFPGPATALLALLLPACGTPVLVVDQAGRPVEGARITAVSPSLHYEAVTSNAEGRASIRRRFVQEVEWLDVSKEGYRPQRAVPFRHLNRTTVVLRR